MRHGREQEGLPCQQFEMPCEPIPLAIGLGDSEALITMTCDFDQIGTGFT